MKMSIDRDKCIRCLSCVDECPNIHLDEDGHKPILETNGAINCNGCTSRRCSIVCPVGAIGITYDERG